MVGFDDAIVLGAVSSAAASIAALVATLLKKAQHNKAVHVSVDGKSFSLEGVDPAEVEAVLERLRQKAEAERGDVPAATA